MSGTCLEIIIVATYACHKSNRKKKKSSSWLPNWQTDKCYECFVFPVDSRSAKVIWLIYSRQLSVFLSYSRPSGCPSELSRAKSHWPTERYANHLGPNFWKIISNISKSDSASLFSIGFIHSHDFHRISDFFFKLPKIPENPENRKLFLWTCFGNLVQARVKCPVISLERPTRIIHHRVN